MTSRTYDMTKKMGALNPETGDYFSAFKNNSDFWSDAAGLETPLQDDTPPTSLSTPAGSLAGSCIGLRNSLPATLSSIGTENLKRKTSQASIEHYGRLVKKRRVAPDSSDSSPLNLSPTYNIQRGIDARQLPYSVQWELARIVSKGIRTWEGEDKKRTITFQDLDYLRPSGDPTKQHYECARKFAEKFSSGEHGDSLFSNRSKDEKNATEPWVELEKEDQFERKHPQFERINESGGRIHFTATLKISTDRKHLTISDYRVELNPAELGTSCSFSRRFGSKSFFRLKVPKSFTQSALNGDLIDFLCKPIILCQGVFRAFYAKEQTAFYFRTNEKWDALSESISPSALGLGLIQFLNWYNSIESNQEQTMAKWASRFALGLSSSIHGITLAEENIEVVDDINSEQGSDMTDGAGFITRRLLQKLRSIHDWPICPSAVQIRIRGSKGLLIEHPTLDNETLGIQLRPSLIKIRYDEPLDITQRSIDILRFAHARSPTRISADVIINLASNGVGDEVLKALMGQTVDAVVQPLLYWDLDDRNVLHELWLNFERSGSVIKSRRAREEAALARVNGHTERDITEEVQEDDETPDLEDVGERSVEWWPDEVSGCPSSLEETIMGFLDSGFHPSTCAILREKIFSVVQKTITRVIENCVIDIPHSASAWIVPDPLGTLEPNQLFFRSSQANLAVPDGTETDIITGDILITRDPCRLPTDVQKWKAVDILQLHYLKDVIVLSVKGPRRAADWLAGGDYDGDKAKLIWQPELVREFNNADEHFADPPSDLDSYFEVSNERVGHFLDRVGPLTQEEQLYEMQKYLLGTMKDQAVVGRYSMFHEYSTCVNGYKHETTKLLAHIFTQVLDGRKTGKLIKKDILNKHHKEFGQKKLNWKETLRKKSEGGLAPNSNINPVWHPHFIMEKLASYGKALEKQHLAKLEQQKKSFKHEPDAVLLKPMKEIEEKIKTNRDPIVVSYLAHDLNLIKDHVEAMYRQHRDDMRAAVMKHNEKARQTTLAGAAFTNLPIQLRQDILRNVSRHFHARPHENEFFVLTPVAVDRIKASYAYYYDSEQSQPTRFPWDVAFRELCCIKAGNEVKPVHKKFYDHMKIKLSKKQKYYW